MPSRKEYFDDHEAEAILRLAAAKHGSRGGISRRELEASASELGITHEALVEAEREYFERSRLDQERKDYDRYLASEFRAHLGAYVLVNLGLVAFDFVPDRHLGWAYWPIFGWGIALLLHLWMLLTGRGGDEYERGFERFRERRRKADFATASLDVREAMEWVASEIDVERDKIAAIRALRERTGLGLKDAKDTVDAYLEQRSG